MELLSSILGGAGGAIIAGLIAFIFRDASKNIKIIHELIKVIDLHNKRSIEHTIKQSVEITEAIVKLTLPKSSVIKKVLIYTNSSLIVALSEIAGIYNKKSENKAKNNKEATIVGMIMGSKIRSSSISYLILFSSLLAHYLFSGFSINEMNGIFVFTISLAALLVYLDQQLIVYRVNKGWYGRNEFEAREIITFILNHSNKDDFTDGDGIKKVLPDAELEELKREYSQMPGIGAT